MRLRSWLRAAFDGDPWHGGSLRANLRGVGPEIAAAKPVNGAHSIWELVLHIRAWREEVIRRLEGGSARNLRAEDDWPAVPEPTRENWEMALLGLDATAADLDAALSGVPGADMDDCPPNSGWTPEDTLVGLLQHDAYHAGQIALLKRAIEGPRQ